jgi:hypothetical protein
MLLASTSQSLGRSEERHQNIFNDKRKTFNFIIISIPHPVPEEYSPRTGHLKIVELSHLRSHQSRYFMVTKISS